MEGRKILIVAFICALLLIFSMPAAGEEIATQAGFHRAPVEEWSQTFGGSEYDWGNSVAQTSDGGYIIAGTTYSYGAGYSDVWLIKTDGDGNEEWNQTFGGSAVDYGDSVAQTSDGGYIIAGSTQSYGDGSFDVWLIKTDADGNEEWDKTFGGSGEEHGRSVTETSDGGYIIAGSTQSYGAGGSDVWLIKTDASGTEEWNQTFGGSDYDYGYSVAQTSDGGYVIAGSTQSYGTGNSDVWLIKTDASGTEEWNQTFGGSSGDYGRSLAQTSDDGYIIAGATYSYGAGGSDVWLIKTDASGTEEWNNVFGGSDYEDGYSVAVTSDGGYIFTGDTGSYGAGYSDVWLIKLGDADTPPPEAVTVSIDAPDEAAPDSDFTANINISEVTDFDACNYDVTFDASVLQLDNVTSGLIGSTTIPVDMYNEVSSGTYRVIQNVPGLSGATGSGYLAVLHFHVVGSEGDSSAITLANGMLSNNQAEEIEATWVGDSVEITSSTPGDANGDGVVNALDITKIERIIAGLDAETDGADANGDGNVNALDITKIERIIAGLD